MGKIPVSVQRLGIDYLSVAGHKLYAPKGVGALYIQDHNSLEPLIHGAGHEFGLRAGTENVILAVGLGAAAEVAQERLPEKELAELTDHFYSELRETFGEMVVLNGHPEERLPNTLNLSFTGYDAQQLLDKASSIAASTGSACHSDRVELSPVLSAMGVKPEVGRGAIRFSLGCYTSLEDIDRCVKILKNTIPNFSASI